MAKDKPQVEQPPSLYDEMVMAQMAFNKTVFEFGLELIASYRNGTCRDANKTLDAIGAIFRDQPKQN